MVAGGVQYLSNKVWGGKKASLTTERALVWLVRWLRTFVCLSLSLWSSSFFVLVVECLLRCCRCEGW